MNILLCGVPRQKIGSVPELVPGASVRSVSGQDSDRTWKRMVVPADLCIVIPKHMNYKHKSIVKAVFDGNVVHAENFNDAIRLANEAVTNNTNNTNNSINRENK